MRKLKRFFAILIVFVLAITTMPMIEAKAEENMHEITIYKIYANAEGNGVCDMFYRVYPEGTSFGDIYDEYVALDTNEQRLTDGFQEWDLSYSRDTIVDENHGSIYIIADYQDYNMVQFIYSYSQENNGEIVDCIDREYAYLKNDIAQSEAALEEYFIQNYSAYASHAESLGFTEWEAGVPVNWDNDGEWDAFRMKASYANPRIINKTVYKMSYVQNGIWEEDVQTISVAETASMDEIIAQLTPGSDVAGLKFEGWDINVVYDDSIYVTARYDKEIIYLSTLGMSESAEILYDVNIVYLDKYTTYRDVLNSLEPAASTAECTFTGWKLFDESISLDDTIENVDFIDFVATYDKYPVLIEKVYIDNTGSVKVEETVKVYNAGTSMGSIYNENKLIPADALNGSVEWFDGVYEGEISLFNNSLFYNAKYEDKVIVEFDYEYIADVGDYGENRYQSVYVALDNQTCLSEEKLKEYFLNTVVPADDIKHFSKVPFIDWYFAEFIDTTGDNYINHLYIHSEYNTEDVIMIRGWVEYADFYYIWVAEAGQSITLPYKFEGAYLTWYDEDGKLIKDDVYTVPADAQKGDWYWLDAQKDGKIPTKNDAVATFKDESKVLPEGVTLSSERLESGVSFDLAKKLVEAKVNNILDMAVFEINLYDKDGIKLQQLNGKILLSLELPFEVENSNILHVYRVDGEELVECKVVSNEAKWCTIEVDHFSTFVFVEQKGVPATGDTTNVLPYMILLLMGAGVFMVGSKKRGLLR